LFLTAVHLAGDRLKVLGIVLEVNAWVSDEVEASCGVGRAPAAEATAT
jgi:hypothetical protein